jgi:F0F1-type ATP synthase assembly protein I
MQNNKQVLLQYAGLATQLFVSLGIAAYAGYWIDKYFIHSFPIFVWLLPMIVLVALIFKIIKDTSK